MIEKIKKFKWTEGLSDSFLPGTVIFIVAFALYAISLNFGYVLDDTIVIVENNFVKKGVQGIGDIMTTEGFVGYFGEQKDYVAGSRYRPLSLVMFALENEIAGNSPWLGHLMNIVLYGLLGILIFVLGGRIGPSGENKWYVSFGFLLAILFVTHPVHSEVVANIKGRDEILTLLFSVSALIAILNIEKRMVLSVLMSTIFFFLALLSKENALPFVVIIPLTAYLFTSVRLSRVFVIIGVLSLSLFAYLWLRFNAIGYLMPKEVAVFGDLMNNPFLGMTLSERFATIAYTLLRYIGLLVWPHPLTHDYYPYHIPKMNWGEALPWMGLILNVGILALGLAFFKKRKLLFWGIVFYFATLFLMSNIPFTVGTFMNERFLFMPSLGLLCVGAFGLYKLVENERTRMVGMVISAVVVIGLSIKTIVRVPVWENGSTLNAAAIKVSRNSARANLFMATDLYNKSTIAEDAKERDRLLTESRRLLDKAVRIYPLYSSAQSMKAGVCAERFKYDKNINALLSCFTEIGADRPDIQYLIKFLDYLDGNARHVEQMIPFYINLGHEVLFREKKNFPQAIKILRRAQAIAPYSKEVVEKLSAVYLGFGEHLQRHPDPKYKVGEIINTGRNLAIKSQSM